jgi:HAD superfamily hydrolase (TIGR01509 family)
MISQVVFDMDGVLIDSERISLGQWKQAGQMCGVDLDMSQFKHLCGSQLSQLSPEVLSHLPPADVFAKITEVRLQLRKKSTEKVPLKPYVTELLDYLAAHQIAAYLASSTPQESAMPRLADLGLDTRLQGYLFGSMVKKRKPEPEIYLLAIKTFNLNPVETVVIEDSESGVIAAYRAGLRVFGVPDQYVIDELQQAGYCTIYPDLHQVKLQIEKENATKGINHGNK